MISRVISDLSYIIYPEESVREHVIENADCWCNPTIKMLCSECDGSMEGCWNCDKGLVVTVDDYDIKENDVIVVHNDK